ncbi:MAG: hypothetical protein HKN13_10565 [Rhodothermales bacterium]|nr:hypothetical protein [Rhodothermales bacterium]
MKDYHPYQFLMLALAIAVLTVGPATAQTERYESLLKKQDVYCGPSISSEDCELVKRVANRIIPVAELPHELHTWPPSVYVHDQKDDDGNSVLNAFAHPCGGEVDEGMPHECSPEDEPSIAHVHITKRLMDEVIQGREQRLAFVFGHELAHITQGHTTRFGYQWRANSELAFLSFGRRQEMEADRFGHLYGVTAGYDSDEMLQSIFRFIELDLSYSSFEGLGVGHPSWEERLSYINEDNRPHWRALNTFRTGVSFLATEQYELAEACFRDVVAKYPQSYEAHANLGYSLLMRYADGLETADVERLGIGHIVVGSFTRRPESLEPDVRGVDTQLWFQATTSLNEALRLNPSLIEAKANLGIAYMIRPTGPETERARALLDEVVVAAKNDADMDARTKAAVLINSGVADLAAGLLKSSHEQFVGAETQMNAYVSGFRSSTDATVHGELYAALQYNAGMLFETQDNNDAQRTALGFFERYLSAMSPSSTWWPIAYKKYAAIGSRLGQSVKSSAEFRTAFKPKSRQVSGVRIANDVLITLGQPREELGVDFGKAYGILANSVYEANLLQEDTDLTEFDLTAIAGVRVVATHEVIAIYIGEGGPEVEIRDLGLGTTVSKLAVGQSVSSLESALGKDYEKRVIVDPQRGYRFYRNAGIAVYVEGGFIGEIVLTQIPVMHVIEAETE